MMPGMWNFHLRSLWRTYTVQGQRTAPPVKRYSLTETGAGPYDLHRKSAWIALGAPIITAILLLCGTAFAQKSKATKETLTSNEKTRSYYLYVPASIKPSAPLIVLLHGSGHNGLSLIDKWKDLADKEGVIIVGPDSADPAVWATPKDGPDFLYDLVEALKQKYSINARRVYLFGHSGGASFGLQIALFESEYFAGIAVHAGALTPNAFKIADFAKRKIPIAIFSGTDDQSVPIRMVRETGTGLKERGFPIEVTEMAHHDHWYYDLAPKINADAWEFLKKYQLEADPSYERIQFRH